MNSMGKEKKKKIFPFRHMKLHKKFFIFFALMSIGMIGIIYIISHLIILGSFEDLEKKETKKQIQQVIRDLERDIFQLKIGNKDYAEWNETYDFMKSKNKEYIQSNLMDETFMTNRWNVFIMINKNGTIQYEKGFDWIKNKAVPVPKNIIRQLEKNGHLFNSLKEKNGVAGIILLPEGAMMISAHPIVKNNLQGPTRGSLIVGRYIKESEIRKLSQESALVISLEKFEEKNILNEYNNMDTSFISKANIWVKNKDKNHISGYALLYDINEDPAFILRGDRARDIYRQGNLSMKYFLGMIVVTYILFYMAFCLFMNKMIFKRFQFLIESVNKIKKNEDLSTRVSVISRDEFSKLEDEFNDMMIALEASHKKITYQAQYDMLTKLPNRYFFYNKVSELLVKAKENNKLAALLFIDLDNFKNINDSSGHGVGDIVLQMITKKLEESATKESIISRIGGDEFIVFLPDSKDTEIVEEVAKKIIKKMRSPLIIEEKQFFISASIGISIYPFDGMDTETLINNADIAMYRVKKERKNSYKFYNKEMRNKLSASMLRQALANGEFKIYYQAQTNGVTENIEGMEALLRWNHPTMGMISPAEFIPLAEETGLIIPMGEWVLHTACTQNKKWQDVGYDFIRVAINISSIQFKQPDFIDTIKKVLEETRLDANYLELEITESIALHKEEEVIHKLLQLRGMGIHVSIDDFGTGCSSLSYLERFPIDSLKIDKTFIHNITHNDTIAKMIIGMAQSLGLSVIAEGVETRDQLMHLINLGCYLMQGYLFSKPVEAQIFEDLLKKNLKN